MTSSNALRVRFVFHRYAKVFEFGTATGMASVVVNDMSGANVVFNYAVNDDDFTAVRASRSKFKISDLQALVEMFIDLPDNGSSFPSMHGYLYTQVSRLHYVFKHPLFMCNLYFYMQVRGESPRVKTFNQFGSTTLLNVGETLLSLPFSTERTLHTLTADTFTDVDLSKQYILIGCLPNSDPKGRGHPMSAASMSTSAHSTFLRPTSTVDSVLEACGILKADAGDTDEEDSCVVQDSADDGTESRLANKTRVRAKRTSGIHAGNKRRWRRETFDGLDLQTRYVESMSRNGRIIVLAYTADHVEVMWNKYDAITGNPDSTELTLAFVDRLTRACVFTSVCVTCVSVLKLMQG